MVLRRRRRRPKSVLERKVRLLFGLTLLVLLSVSFYLANQRLEAVVQQEHRRTARATVAGALMIDHVQWTDPVTHSALGPALGFRHLLEQSQPHQPRRYFATGTRRSAQPADAFERSAVAALTVGARPERFRVVTEDGQRVYQYMTVLRNHQNCQAPGCHAAPNTAVPGGDILGVVSIKLRVEEVEGRMSVNRAFLLYVATATVVIALIVLYAIVRVVITRPVDHLKHVSDRIGGGDLAVRTDLRTGDELEAFGRAFNHTLDTIAANEAELRRVNRDLDEKVEELGYANLALFELNRVKSEFVATMTHEFRTPLNAILGFSEVLAERAADRLDDREQRFLHNIRASGEHLLALINSILDLAKIESGKMELNLERVSVEAVCRGLASNFEPLVAANGLALEIDIPSDLPPIVTDEGKLRQIVYNLMGNAIKFTPAGGRVRVAAAAEDRRVRIEVTDTGIGIPEEHIESVFERFKQVDSSASRRYDGSGLGLAIVHELVRLLRGEVSVESAVGKGSTFIVTLPLEIGGVGAEGVVEVALGDGLDLSKARRVALDDVQTPEDDAPSNAESWSACSRRRVFRAFTAPRLLRAGQARRRTRAQRSRSDG